MGQTIQISATDGSGAFAAYLATPRGGSGPGIVLCQEIFGVNAAMRELADRYAEEGYVVLVPDLFWRLEPGVELGHAPHEWQRAFELFQRFDQEHGMADLDATIHALRGRRELDAPYNVGVVGYCLGGRLAFLAACRFDIACAVGYYAVGLEDVLHEAEGIAGRLVLHIAGEDKYCAPAARERIAAAFSGNGCAEVYVYPGADHAFARPAGEHYDKPADLMSHQRTIAALKREIGPEFDLSALWDKHCEYEFATRDVDDTMATMVPEPYVNHIPTMTGGVGYRQLKRFYRHHFVHGNPPDTRLVPLSRTVGASQIVDEVLFCFTHTTEIDWMLPGIAPTGRYVEIPLVAIVKFRGDKLYHEHIYWDQASVLVQIGKLDDGSLPVAGIDTARKLLDETLPSNTLMARWSTSADLAA
ncbi:dienelactone hydrolase family protein [Paraburkholderia antibiotica]|uniref:Dienelactone hydrolase family protein n=1 Tax=Paraburkholderia antibiotica TaxID=2728839 RepID=A0A7X9X2G3_9BURK|nr:dienelactone hydrolase family protein [Paraburkholderia antibiotica]NML30224.1 dienelactone hydrolase family protein [Paraburkholderia antibiotica]